VTSCGDRHEEKGVKLECDRESIALRLRWHAPAGRPEECLYRLAERPLISDTLLAELVGFRLAGPVTDLASPSGELLLRPENAQPVYRGLGWIDNRWLPVECRRTPEGYWLCVAGAGLFWVAPEGSCLAQVAPGPDADPATVVQTALGPVLILALALHGTWCLHASAVAFRGRAIAFLGESGNGKSTLAAFLGEVGGAEWRPLADDILPVAARSYGVDALPYFPQLKLPPDDQPSTGAPERLPLAAAYRLVEPDAALAAVEVSPLSGSEAALALVRHTVASRLFDPDLLARHLGFCACAATQLPVQDLAYPREWAALPRVRDALRADLERM
jgi:hypothetical protein